MKVVVSVLIVGIAGLISFGGSAQAAGESNSAPSRQLTHSLQRDVSHKLDIQYFVFLPKDYEKSTEKWPLILYLHGGSVRGDDISLVPEP